MPPLPRLVVRRSGPRRLTSAVPNSRRGGRSEGGDGDDGSVIRPHPSHPRSHLCSGKHMLLRSCRKITFASSLTPPPVFISNPGGGVQKRMLLVAQMKDFVILVLGSKSNDNTKFFHVGIVGGWGGLRYCGALWVLCFIHHSSFQCSGGVLYVTAAPRNVADNADVLSGGVQPGRLNLGFSSTVPLTESSTITVTSTQLDRMIKSNMLFYEPCF